MYVDQLYKQRQLPACFCTMLYILTAVCLLKFVHVALAGL